MSTPGEPAPVWALIPARGGSKGIPGKNLRMLAGRPLIAHTIETARASGLFTRILVTTDSPEIARVAGDCGAEVPFLRPGDLARDDTPMLPVIRHALDTVDPAGSGAMWIALLQPTAPLRTVEHLCDAVRLAVERPGVDTVVSVVPVPGHHHAYWSLRIESGVLVEHHPGGLKITRRQDLPPLYARDGTIYLFRRSNLARHGGIYGSCIAPLVLAEGESVNLDSMEDWREAEKRLGVRP